MPLEFMATIVSLIGSTTTELVVSVECIPDTSKYESGIKITDEETDNTIHWVREFHPGWNYINKPNSSNGTEG